MKIANRLIVASSLLLAAGCAHHDRQTSAGYSSTTYGTVGTSGAGAYSSTDRYNTSDRSARYSSPNASTETSGSFNSQSSQNSASVSGGFQGDAGLTTQVQQSLKNDTSIANFSSGIMVNAQNGTVTLTGTVPSEQDKQKVESMVKNTSGVVTVNNQLQVSLRPTSERQDQGSRIYHDSKDQGSISPGATTSPTTPPSDFSKPQTSTTGTSTSDLTASGTASAGTTGLSKNDQPNSATSPTGTSGTADLSSSTKSDLNTPGAATSATTDSSKPSADASGTAAQSTTPSTPTSDRSSTRIYGDQKNTSSGAVSGDASAAGTLSFNVQGTTEADKSIGRQVMQELRSDATFGAMLNQIKINVESGKVTLTGNVKSEDQKQKAESIAQKVTGVSTIDNQLKINAEASTGASTDSK